jgi:hypothetical protein
MAIATLIVIALAIANSISPFSAFFSDKSPAQSFAKVVPPTYAPDTAVKRYFYRIS